MKRYTFLLVFLFLLLFVPIVFAGGGRITISPSNTQTTVGLQNRIDAWVFTPSSNMGQNTSPSANEHVQFIAMARPGSGDVCVTVNGTSDSQGYVQGTCTTTTPGTFEVYVKSLDRGDQSSPVLISFVAPPTVVLTATPMMSPKVIPTPTLPVTAQDTPTPQIQGISMSSPYIIFSVLLGIIIAVVMYMYSLKKKTKKELITTKKRRRRS